MSSVPKLLIGLSCPGCGGTNEVTEGSRLAFCPYCGSALAITADDAGVTRLMYKMEITEAEAERSARKWFGAFPKARDLSATAVITEIFPMYLPFWRVVGTGKGVACGYSTHTDKDGHTQRTYHEDSSDAEYLWSVIACQTGDLGIATPPELKGTLLPYTDGDIPVFEITSSRDEAYDQADTDIRMEAHRRAASGIETLTFSKTFCIPREFSLLYYPYWIVRYQYRERDYFVVLDGVSGDPVSGRAPGDQTYQALAAGLGAGFGGLFAGLGVAYAVFSNSEYALAGLSGLVIGLILVLAGYWMFRFGSEVTEGKLTGGVTFSMKGFGQKTVREIER
ncbi:MAG TPA: hypothetical protein O0X03_01890 [Methanocorpusculum sp.]|nr:hypothetical protein [Methanocorpusculum sp.]